MESDWSAVSAGDYHSIAIKSDGTIWAWGDNEYGQLGNDGIIWIPSQPQPRQP